MWHYLNKNPNDLPPEKEVLVLIEYKTWYQGKDTIEYAYDLGTRRLSGNWCLDVFKEENEDTKIVAWCELPEVDMEEVK